MPPAPGANSHAGIEGLVGLVAPLAAAVVVFALQAVAGVASDIAFPAYLATVLASGVWADRRSALGAAGLGAAGMLGATFLIERRPGDAAASLVLSASLIAVALAMGQFSSHSRADTQDARRRLADTRARAERLSAIIDGASVGLASADGQGRLVQANGAFGGLAGRPIEQLAGAQLATLFVPLQRPALQAALAELREGLTPHWRGELGVDRPDGSDAVAAVSISRLDGVGEAPVLLVQASDVSARKRTEGLHGCLVAIQEVMVGSPDWQGVVPQLLASLGRFLGWESAVYWVTDSAEGRLKAQGVWRAQSAEPGPEAPPSPVLSQPRGEGLVGRVWQSGVVAAEGGVVGGTPAGSACALPVVDAGNVIGVIELTGRRSPVLDDEATLLTTAGIEIGQFIRRSATEQALRRSEADHRAIYERSPIGIARISAEGDLLEANPALLQMLEHDLETMRQNSWPELLRAYDQAAARQRQAPLLAGITDAGSIQVRAATGSGRWVWLQLSATSIPDASGSPEHVLLMVEDVTVVRETSDKLAEALESQRSANANLERLDRTKTEFLSITSHEFRTALTGIQGFSELIRDGGLEPEEMRSYGGYIFNDADRVNRLIGDMLDLDRMESGRMTIRTADVDINQVLSEAMARARSSTTMIEFKSDLDPGLPIVTGDRDRLTQVVSNLVGNSVKYSPDGGTVVLSSRIEGSLALISVSDTGLGIPPEEIGHVFERFRRVRTGAAQSIPGTGLGLTIVKQIVEMHGGRIWVESALGHGSSFHFTVPLSPSSLSQKSTRRG